LSDSDRKAQYDRFGHAGMRGNGGGGGHYSNMEDIFSQFGDIFGESGFESFLAEVEDLQEEAAAPWKQSPCEDQNEL
jgi:DnaJ-class molecular chaperone